MESSELEQLRNKRYNYLDNGSRMLILIIVIVDVVVDVQHHVEYN